MIVVGRHVFFRAVLRWGAALAFCYPLKHRERFWLRAVELLLSLMALTWLLDPMAQSNSLVQLQVSLLGMYVGFFILLGAMIYACVEIDKKSALYCAVWSLLTAQTAYEGWNLFELLCAVKSHPLNMNSVPVKLLQVLTGVVFYGVICGTLARKIPDKGVYHIGPRQLASAFFMGIMFMLQAALLSSAQALDWPMSVVGTTLIGQLYFLTLLYLQTELFKKSDLQKEMVQELSKRAAEIHSGTVDASVDNMLCVTNDGRKIGLDVRLMNPMLPDDPNSKLNVCVQNVLKIWEEGKDQKLTQLLFCDLSTPKNDGNFNVYDDIRKKLIAAGVPENEIEFIHNADTEAKKAALFSKVRSGDVRVLLGSTAKMGAGTNVQSRLVAVHHLDVGWKPSDMTQRNGRIIRQGNMNKEVKVFNYVTEGTFDSYLFQTLENKQRFISQIMTSKSPVRSCEDVDEQALSYAEIKALCAGNPLIKEKMDLDVQVAKLKVLKADHQSQKFRLQDKLLTKFPADIQETNAHIAGLKADAQLAAAHPQVQEGFCGMTIKGVTYDEKKTAGERLVLACSELPNAEEKVIGSYRGFELSLRFDTFRSEYQAILKGQRRYPVALGTDPLGNIIRLDNSLNNFPERINSAENELATLHQQQAAAQIEVEKPFPQEEELAEKSARLAELNAQLDVDEKSHEPEQDEEEQEDAPRRPSVLAALEEKSDKPEPVKPFRSYYDKDGDAR